MVITGYGFCEAGSTPHRIFPGVSTPRKENNYLILTAMPGYVGICTKYVTAGLNDGHGGSLSITVVVEYRCSRTVSLGMPTPHKPATLRVQEHWVQKRNQLLHVIFAIQVAKNDG